MSRAIQIQIEAGLDAPAPGDLSRWAAAALSAAGATGDGELTIRIVDSAEIADLNARFRNRPQVTNVLSFAAELPPGVPQLLLGDIVICAPVVAREAIEQGKPDHAHWAHMTIHGTLHLLGFDHQTEAEAAVMEGLEATILVDLGYPAPY